MRSFLTLLLITVGVPAWAQLEKVGESRVGVTYIDLATLSETGDLRTVWRISDFKQRDLRGQMSTRTLNEYDCQTSRFRNLASFDHSEPMAKGRVLASSELPEAWRPVVPTSTIDDILRRVCSARRDDPKAGGGAFKP